MSEVSFHIEDPFRRPKRIVPPHQRRSPEAATVATVRPDVTAKADLQTSPGNGFIEAAILSLVGAGLVVYAFNFHNLRTLSDGLVSRWNANAQMQGALMAPMMAKVLPYLILVPAVFLLYMLASTLTSMLVSRNKNPKKSSRGPREDFRNLAYSRGVRSREAYQTFLLLEPHLPEGHVLDVSDRLEEDLALTHQQIRAMRIALLEKTEREFDPRVPLVNVSTVLGMMVSNQLTPGRTRTHQGPVFLPGDPIRKRA